MMQLSAQPVLRGLMLTDVQKLRKEGTRLRLILQDPGLNTENFDYHFLKMCIRSISEIVYIVDIANEFHRVVGFDVFHKLLSLNENEVKMLSAELIADLVQNNPICQQKAIDAGLTDELLNMLETEEDVNIRTKVLYAISSLCRSNPVARARFQELDGLASVVQSIHSPHDRLKTKAAFFLACLVDSESQIREKLYEVGFVLRLADLVKEDRFSCCEEHLLNILLIMVAQHKPSALVVTNLPSLKVFLKENLQLYAGREEFQEAMEYSGKILSICFQS